MPDQALMSRPRLVYRLLQKIPTVRRSAVEREHVLHSRHASGRWDEIGVPRLHAWGILVVQLWGGMSGYDVVRISGGRRWGTLDGPGRLIRSTVDLGQFNQGRGSEADRGPAKKDLARWILHLLPVSYNMDVKSTTMIACTVIWIGSEYWTCKVHTCTMYMYISSGGQP